MPNQTPWPHLNAPYLDEFGHIDPDIYQLAGELWPAAEKFPRMTLHDAPAGLRLMLKSASLVTRARSSERTNIQNLPSYLYRTFKRLVLEELEKENRHQRLAAEAASALSTREETGAVTLGRKILIQQLIGRMDASTRQVFELLILGHTYDEIGLFIGKDGQAVRTKYSKRIRKLIKKIEAENLLADERLKNSV
jgi:hypothetical protein